MATNECPTSQITAESNWLVDQVSGALYVGKAARASFFGVDSAEWPAYWFDAVGVIHSAMQEAESIEMAK